jgi:hypothetical protein
VLWPDICRPARSDPRLIKQQAANVESAAFDGHVEGGVIAIPHEPSGVNVDAVREKPSDSAQVSFIDGKVKSDRVNGARRICANGRTID